MKIVQNPHELNSGNVLDLWIVFLEGSQSIHCDVSYPQIQDTTQNLVVPENIILFFQPPYCPELNPIERLWEEIKKHIKWSSFKLLII